nr:putative LEE-encoded type III secretion system factor [Edwardsiella sp. EA181011]
MKMIKCNAEYKKRDKLNIAYLSAISTITTIKSRIKNEKNR